MVLPRGNADYGKPGAPFSKPFLAYVVGVGHARGRVVVVPAPGEVVAVDLGYELLPAFPEVAGVPEQGRHGRARRVRDPHVREAVDYRVRESLTSPAPQALQRDCCPEPGGRTAVPV
jgi:hypothetical protein